MARPTLVRSILAIAVGAALAACEAPQPLGPQLTLGDIITRVASSDGSVTAELHTGPAPEAGSDAAPTAPAAGTAVNGGSAAVSVSAGSDFTTVIVTIQGVDGYYELTLPAAVSAEDLVLGMAPGLNRMQLQVRLAVGSGGTVGQYAAQTLDVYHVGTGDVQVSVSWTGASDVDLHVFDPNGEEVYFANKQAASGGTLDLDSNPACTIDHINNENVVWPTGSAPRGDYTVEVHYFADCGVPRSDYVVTVAIKGHEPQVFTGSFVGAYTDNPPVTIGTFTY